MAEAGWLAKATAPTRATAEKIRTKFMIGTPKECEYQPLPTNRSLTRSTSPTRVSPLTVRRECRGHVLPTQGESNVASGSIRPCCHNRGIKDDRGLETMPPVCDITQCSTIRGPRRFLFVLLCRTPAVLRMTSLSNMTRRSTEKPRSLGPQFRLDVPRKISSEPRSRILALAQDRAYLKGHRAAPLPGHSKGNSFSRRTRLASSHISLP